MSRRRTGAWIVGLALGCGGATAPTGGPGAAARESRATPTPAETPQADAPEGEAPEGEAPEGKDEPVVGPPRSLDCGPAIEGLRPLLAQPQVVLLGEAHGTAQIPEFLGTLACHAAAQGLEVAVGFESYGDQQGAFQRYVQSDGSPAAREVLLQARHWKPDPDTADGRSSVAMLGMFERLRVLRAQGIPVFAFPVGPQTSEEHAGHRDEWMAQRVVEARRAHPDAMIFVLAGSGHTAVRTTEEQPRVGTSMGWFLVHEHHVPVVSLAWKTAGGTRWNPVEVDYQSEVGGEDLQRSPFIQVGLERADLDGFFYVGPTTASPPARHPDALTKPAK